MVRLLLTLRARVTPRLCLPTCQMVRKLCRVHLGGALGSAADAVPHDAAFEAEQDATKAGRPFSRLRVPFEPMSAASRVAFDRLMKESDITAARRRGTEVAPAGKRAPTARAACVNELGGALPS